MRWAAGWASSRGVPGGPGVAMSLPNIDKSREGLYLALLSLQLVAWTAVTTANEIARGEDGVLAGIVSVGESMGQSP